MTWTTRTPTQPGYYWVRDSTLSTLPVIVFIYQGNDGLWVADDSGVHRIAGYTSQYGEWSSEPIKEPEDV